MKRKPKYIFLFTFLVFLLVFLINYTEKAKQDKKEVLESSKNKETVEVILNDRQKKILKQEGLSENYDELSFSQQRSIIRIEEMLSYADEKYEESFSYSGYIAGNTIENETTIAFPNSNPNNVFEITGNKFGFYDTYMNIFLKDDFLAYLEENTKTILSDVEFRLYGDIINTSFDKKQESDYDFKGNVDGAFLIFIDGKTFGSNDIHQFELSFSKFMREQSLFGSVQVIVTKNYDIDILSEYNYTDYLEEDLYSYRDRLYFNK